MITIHQLKEVLMQGEAEILSDMVDDRREFDRQVSNLEDEFNKAETIHDIILIYEGKGFETYEANNVIIGTLMQLATLD